MTVRNEGTLPAQVMFQMVDDGPDGKVDVDEITVENVTVNGDAYGEKVTQTGEQVACDASNYILKDKLKIFVYQKNSEGNWGKVPNVNLNEASTGRGVRRPTFQPFTSEEPLPAGSENEEQFLIAGYLPEDAGNAYQAKHYHGVLLAMPARWTRMRNGARRSRRSSLLRPSMESRKRRSTVDYYTISFQEDFDTVDAWKAAVQESQSMGWSIPKQITSPSIPIKPTSCPLQTMRSASESGSFQSGTTYHVVVEAEGMRTSPATLLQNKTPIL